MATTGGANTVVDGLVLALDAANHKSYPGSGTTWYDLSGNGNNGTLTNGPTFSPDNGGSIVFDGTNDYINGFDNISISQSEPFTIESWANLSAYTPANQVLCQIKTDTANAFIIFAITNDSYDGITFGSTDTWRKLRNSGNELQVNTWYHIVVTYNGNGAGDTGNYKMYLNNQEQTLSDSSSLIPLNQVNNIGTANNGARGVDQWNGNISNFKLYHKELTAEEIQQNYNATKSRFGL